MYFPFFYGRRSELLALRSLLNDHRSLSSFVPVIEAVNADTADLTRCLVAYGTAELPVAVLMNPNKHQLDSLPAAKAWRAKLATTFAAHSSLIPTYRCHSATTQSQVDAFLKLYPAGDVAIAYASPALSDKEIGALCSNTRIRYHIVMNGKMSAAQRTLLPVAKEVDIRDDFNKLERNKDYAGSELFTDRHKLVPSNYVGFGDFAAIGSAFQTGGSTPHAVAIHAVYLNRSTSDLWIEHFVSDDTDKDVGSVAAKFVQAARKLAIAAKKRPTEFGSNFALDAFALHAKASSYPGLGKSKELQIAHHVCLMLDVLSGSL